MCKSDTCLNQIITLAQRPIGLNNCKQSKTECVLFECIQIQIQITFEHLFWDDLTTDY